MGYKDITFCTFYEECTQGKDCKRALTAKVKEAAQFWWGTSIPPIDLFLDKPDCFNQIKKNE